MHRSEFNFAKSFEAVNASHFVVFKQIAIYFRYVFVAKEPDQLIKYAMRCFSARMPETTAPFES